MFSGSCCTVEDIEIGNIIGIVWITNTDNTEIGFVYDADKSLKKDVPQKVAKFCDDNSFECLSLDSAKRLVTFAKARYEKYTCAEFRRVFGDIPNKPLEFFDSGGMINSAQAVFKIKNDEVITSLKLANHNHLKRALKTAGITFLVLAFIVALFIGISAFSSYVSNSSFLETIFIYMFVFFFAIGTISIVQKIRVLALKIYYFHGKDE
jgi:hypothetical protein